MAKLTDVGSRLRAAQKKLRAEFESVVHRFEAGDLAESIKLSAEAAASAKDLVAELIEAYPENLNDRIQKIDSIQRELKALSGKSKDDLDQDDLLTVMLSLESSIRLLEREIRFQYKAPFVLPLAKKYRNKVAAAVALIVVVAGGVTVVNYFRLKSHGLTGKYYAGMNFERYLKTRVDHEIKFDWVRRSPGVGIPKDKFSIRWEGAVRVVKAGAYDIAVGSDDGSRLWIDDQQIIDAWKTQKYTVVKATMTLTEGDHKVRLDYFENGNTAGVDLLWRHEADVSLKTVPYENLVPADPGPESR